MIDLQRRVADREPRREHLVERAANRVTVGADRHQYVGGEDRVWITAVIGRCGTRRESDRADCGDRVAPMVNQQRERGL